MNITELKAALELNSDKRLKFILPNKSAIPGHFHITEVGYVQKDFIDCGGTRRATASCVLQAWVAADDEDHSLNAGRLASILKLAGKVLPSEELEVEVEFEAPYISQFPITTAETSGDAVIFHLTTKHTDCLAKEQCGLESANSSCGSNASKCC